MHGDIRRYEEQEHKTRTTSTDRARRCGRREALVGRGGGRSAGQMTQRRQQACGGGKGGHTVCSVACVSNAPEGSPADGRKSAGVRGRAVRSGCADPGVADRAEASREGWRLAVSGWVHLVWRAGVRERCGARAPRLACRRGTDALRQVRCVASLCAAVCRIGGMPGGGKIHFTLHFTQRSQISSASTPVPQKTTRNGKTTEGWKR